MLALDAEERPTSSECLKHDFFTKDKFDEWFLQEFRTIIQKENETKPLSHATERHSAEDGQKKAKLKKDITSNGTKKVSMI